MCDQGSLDQWLKRSVDTRKVFQVNVQRFLFRNKLARKNQLIRKETKRPKCCIIDSIVCGIIEILADVVNICAGCSVDLDYDD